MSTTYPPRPAQPLPRTAADDVPEGPSFVSRIPEITARAAWKHRWRLAPVYLASCASVGVGMGDGLAMAGGLGAAAVAAEVTARGGWTTPNGRMFLSAWERRLAGIGLGATAAWAALMASPAGLPWFADAALLGGALGWPSYRWWGSRKPVGPPPSLLSPMALAVLEGWDGHIAIGAGPRQLLGSSPVEGSIREPAEGALTMDVQLRYGVNAKEVVGTASRNTVEALLSPVVGAVLAEGMGADTVRMETIREDPTKVRVILTPSRHLEVEGGLPWLGPILYENGLMPLAEGDTGDAIDIPLHDGSGVKHGFITGTTGSGKSVTTAAVILPGVLARLELVFYIDGKDGGSTGEELDPAITRMSVSGQQHREMIEMVYRIFLARKKRRGRLRLKKWVTGQETDPIITLLVDEATGVNKLILGKHVDMIATMCQQGRTLGIRIIQVVQSPAAENLIGDVAVRDLLTSGGWAVCHRAGGTGSSRLTLDSAGGGIDIDLRGMPDGQSAILVQGRLAGHPAQVRYASDEAIIAALAEHVTGELVGGDLEAAGQQYAAKHWGYDETGEPAEYVEEAGSAQAKAPAAEDEALLYSRLWVLEQLLKSVGGHTIGQLEAAADADPKDAPSRSTIKRALLDLFQRKQATKTGVIWTATRPEAIDEEITA